MSKIKKHPNQHGDRPRVRLGTTLVAHQTHKRLTAWRGAGLSMGVIVDRLTDHAIKTSFDPIHLPVPTT